MPDSEDDDIRSYVAACPVTPRLAEQIAGLAELPWDDHEVTGQAMRRLGWDNDPETVLDEVRFVTDRGHLVYGDFCFAMPFSYSYTVGGELMEEDFWGSLPGWSSRRDAGTEEFDAHLTAAVDRFAEHLGPPHHDVRKEGRTVSTGRYSWRYAAWRRGGNLLVVGQDLDPFSYSQFEESLVYIGALAEDAPFPEAAEFPKFLTW
ncbi:hypothetical protein ACRYCC_19495 [Actinomadura scrupuli]|uniref:hypothetical protein n=1 Tax=Actinomadura scrupuli TaxID=559629 RepID=UPI003D983C61